MITENRHQFWSKSLYWGLEIGADIVLYCIVAQWLWDRPFDVTGIVPSVILTVCIYMCHKDMIKLDPKIPFAELLLAGLCAGASGSLIVDLYAAIYVKAYDPAYMEEMVQQSAAMAERLGYQDGDILESSRKVFVPVLMVTTTLVYIFVSLVMSAFGAFMVNIRRKNNNGGNVAEGSNVAGNSNIENSNNIDKSKEKE